MTIGEAWDEMQKRQPIDSVQQVQDLVAIVHGELMEAMVVKGPHPDVTVSELRPEGFGSMFRVIVHGNTKSVAARWTERSTDNMLYATTPGHEEGSYLTSWIPENGPQKAWVLDNLRAVITASIEEA